MGIDGKKTSSLSSNSIGIEIQSRRHLLYIASLDSVGWSWRCLGDQKRRPLVRCVAGEAKKVFFSSPSFRLSDLRDREMKFDNFWRQNFKQYLHGWRDKRTRIQCVQLSVNLTLRAPEFKFKRQEERRGDYSGISCGLNESRMFFLFRTKKPGICGIGCEGGEREIVWNWETC